MKEISEKYPNVEGFHQFYGCQGWFECCMRFLYISVSLSLPYCSCCLVVARFFDDKTLPFASIWIGCVCCVSSGYIGFFSKMFHYCNQKLTKITILMTLQEFSSNEFVSVLAFGKTFRSTLSFHPVIQMTIITFGFSYPWFNVKAN